MEPFWAELAADEDDEAQRVRYLALSALYDNLADCSESVRIDDALDRCRVMDPLSITYKGKPVHNPFALAIGDFPREQLN